MIAYVFPGQGTQHVGMGKALYQSSTKAKNFFEKANEILGFRITDIMFNGTVSELRQTKITQPAIYLHSVILAKTIDKFSPQMLAGHSLGEFSALTVARALSFENGLKLVSKRAEAMQRACELEPSSMAVIIGLKEDIIERICESIEEIVVLANYNATNQMVISGSIQGIDIAIGKLKEIGGVHAIKLPVGGAFHSPLMNGAKEELEVLLNETHFSIPFCPVYQNVDAKPAIDPEVIKDNLIKQLVSPVQWIGTIRQMVEDGADEFIEVGPGKVLQGLIKAENRQINVISISQ